MDSSIIVVRTPDKTTSYTIVYPTQGQFLTNVLDVMLANKSKHSTFTIASTVSGGEIIDITVYRDMMYWIAESNSHDVLLEHVKDMDYGKAIKSIMFRTYFNRTAVYA